MKRAAALLPDSDLDRPPTGTSPHLRAGATPLVIAVTGLAVIRDASVLR